MIAYQQMDMAGDFGRYPGKLNSHMKSPSTYRDSVISVSTMNSAKSSRTKYTQVSVASSRSSLASYGPDSKEHQKKYRFDTAPTLVKTPWEADRAKRAFSRQWQGDGMDGPRPSTGKSTRSGITMSLPSRIFKNLPAEVYMCIVEQLAAMHFDNPSGTCLTCYLGELTSLCLTSKAFAGAASRIMYRKLWIPVDDPSNRQIKSPLFLRLKLLRRTLRDRPDLAALVEEMHIPGCQTVYTLLREPDRTTTVSTVASLIMCCPNLEQFTGLNVNFDHEYDRLTHALSTRPMLKVKTWVMKGIDEVYDETGKLISNARPIEYDGSIDNGDVFLNSHPTWQNLETLMLFGQDTGNLDYRAFVGTFRTLSSLKHLLISQFDKKQFNDRTLSAIPLDLHSLRLDNLPGITERGLTRLTTSINSMRNLSLINLEIPSARLIASFMAMAPRLVRFTLAQSVSPSLPPDMNSTDPIYESKSLKFLHWDISLSSQPSVGHLEASILAGAFPSLTGICVPGDDGSLQAICRPRAQIAQPSDSEAVSSLSLRSSLASARIAAQNRLEMARVDPLMRVVVTDEFGVVQHKYTIKNYMGEILSPIHYILDGRLGNGTDDTGVPELQALMSMPETVDARRSNERLGSCCGPPQRDMFDVKRNSTRNLKAHRPRERVTEVPWKVFF